MSNLFFKVRDGNTPLPPELQRGLRIKTIQSMGELDEHEEANIARGLAWLQHRRDDPTDYAFWLKLHKKLFADVWTWAGKVREHELQNEEFHRQAQLWRELKKLSDDLRFWIQQGTFAEDELTARFHERIETIHPFPNGNGRFGRILVEYFARTRGKEIPTWGRCLQSEPQRRRAAYTSGLTTARTTGDYAPLIRLMYG